ncbi:MAG: DUF58 domain-containing protein [Chromatiales bacterium]|jgi:uncharacterized protein (DUF58 family)
MPVPERSLFVLLWLALAAALPAGARPELFAGWLWLLGGGLAAALLDGVRLYLLPPPEASRSVPGSLSLGRWQRVGLRLIHRGTSACRVDVFDHHPARFDAEHLPRALVLRPGAWVGTEYRVKPTERGEHRFAGVQLHMHAPWRFWKRSVLIPVEQPVRVYPNFALVAKYTLLATDNRLSQMGVRRQVRRGQGLEFHQLREYRQGDSLRQIDWKNTARLRRPIAREYQDERDQEVVLLIDCSRRMLAKDGELSHFDFTLNASLLLAYVALRQGDAVGLGTFGGERRWLKPTKGRDHLNRVLNTLYDLHPTTRTPDYVEAVHGVLLRQRRRALVVLLTNLRDEDNGDLGPAVKVLGRRHLVLVVNLVERALEAALERPVRDFDDALRAAAIQLYQADQRRALDRLTALGVERLDISPEDLSVELVNRYLEIKAGGRL